MQKMGLTEANAFTMAAFTVEPSRNLISHPNGNSSLEPRIMDVLCVLAANTGDVITRDTLIDQIWKVQFGADESLTRAISILRKTFRAVGETDMYIETIPRRGYRLTHPITPLRIKSKKSQTLVPKITSYPHHISSPLQTHAPQIEKRRTYVLGLSLLVFIGLAFFALKSKNGNPPATIPISTTGRSAAVLPFIDMSETKDQEYFSDGITEEILHALTQIPDLRMAGRSSAFAFKGKNIDIREIGASLNVSHIIEGSVRKQGERIRVTAQLTNTSDGLQMWSKSYDGTLDNIFVLQERISRDIATELQIVLSIGIEQVIDLDPNFNIQLSTPTPPTPSFEIARPNARHAIWMHPNEAEEQTSATLFSANATKLEAALTHSDQIIASQPNHTEAFVQKGWILMMSGQAQAALDTFEQARQIRPLSSLILTNITALHQQLGKTDSALIMARRNARWNPQDPHGFIDMASILANEGDYIGAHSLLKNAQSLAPDFVSLQNDLVHFYSQIGMYTHALNVAKHPEQKVLPLLFNEDTDAAQNIMKSDLDNIHFANMYYLKGNMKKAYPGFRQLSTNYALTNTTANAALIDIIAITAFVLQDQGDNIQSPLFQSLKSYFSNKSALDFTHATDLKAGAVLQVLEHKPEEAILWIDRFIELGFADIHFLTQPAFKSLRNHSKFSNLENRMQDNIERQQRAIENQLTHPMPHWAHP